MWQKKNTLRLPEFSPFPRTMSSKPPCFKVFNPLPNDKIVDVTKLKTSADNKSNIAYMMISLFDRVENTVGKGENAGHQHFLLFPQCFPKPSFKRKKSGLCGKGLLSLGLYRKSLGCFIFAFVYL